MSRLPTFSQQDLGTAEDSTLFTEQLENQAVTTGSDNGYIYVRPRHSRKAKRIFTTGFSDLTQTQKVELEAFYTDRLGGVEAFEYLHPVTKELINVRFDKDLPFRYMGQGGNHYWSVEFSLKEV